MNCPICLSVMRCESEIHQHNKFQKRMDLHCFNHSCKSFEVKYGTHMGVLTNDPNPWECYSYHFAFLDNGIWYKLSGDNGETRLFTEKEEEIDGSTIGPLTLGKSGFPYKLVYKWRYWDVVQKELFKANFIPISTDNDMHIEAWKLFEKLKKYSCIK